MSKTKRTSLLLKLGDPALPMLNREIAARKKRNELAPLKKTMTQAVIAFLGPKHPKLLQGVNLTSIFGAGKVPANLQPPVG